MAPGRIAAHPRQPSAKYEERVTRLVHGYVSDRFGDGSRFNTSGYRDSLPDRSSQTRQLSVRVFTLCRRRLRGMSSPSLDGRQFGNDVQQFERRRKRACQSESCADSLIRSARKVDADDNRTRTGQIVTRRGWRQPDVRDQQHRNLAAA
jgi:hypothetical protein